MSTIGAVTSTPPPPVSHPVSRPSPQGTGSEEAQESAAQKAREQEGSAQPAAPQAPTAEGVGGTINVIG